MVGKYLVSGLEESDYFCKICVHSGKGAGKLGNLHKLGEGVENEKNCGHRLWTPDGPLIHFGIGIINTLVLLIHFGIWFTLLLFFFSNIKPTRRTPYFYGIVLAMGLVNGYGTHSTVHFPF